MPTDDEQLLLLWGGHGADGARRDGAAYDTATGTWRPIADAPIASEGGPQAVWAGDEMLVVAGFNSVSAAASTRTPIIEPVPGQPAGPDTATVWTGEVMVIRAIYRNAGSSPGIEGGLFAYSPTSDRWTELPRLTEDLRLTAIGYDGDRLLRVTQQPGAETAAYDFTSESWTGIARWPADLPPMGVSVWTGTGLLLWGGDTAVLVDPVDGSITTSPGGVDRFARTPQRFGRTAFSSSGAVSETWTTDSYSAPQSLTPPALRRRSRFPTPRRILESAIRSQVRTGRLGISTPRTLKLSSIGPLRSMRRSLAIDGRIEAPVRACRTYRGHRRPSSPCRIWMQLAGRISPQQETT